MQVTCAKQSPTDILMRVTVSNAGPDDERLHVLPTLWHRNTWSWGTGSVPRIGVRPRLLSEHERLGV